MKLNKWTAGFATILLLAMANPAGAQTSVTAPTTAKKKIAKKPKTVTAEPILTTPPAQPVTLTSETKNPVVTPPPPPDLTLPTEDLPKKTKVAIVPAPSPQNRDDVPEKTGDH